MNKEVFIEIYKSYSVEALSEMLHDSIIGYEKKVESLHEALRKKDDKIKNQAEEITKQQGLKSKLNMANATVHNLIEESKYYRQLGIDTYDKQNEQHESQMKVAESEIKRLNIIINYLETKGL
jgi:chromosome segregation ATPase